MNATRFIPHSFNRFSRKCDVWFRRQGPKRLWSSVAGLAAYDAMVGIFYRHYSHSSHVFFPDPRALWLVIGVTSVSVLFFIAWTVFCLRFRKPGLPNGK